MQQRKPPTPAAAKVLAKILELAAAGQPVTHGELCRTMEYDGKSAVSLALKRLEKGGWIRRPKHRPGCTRAISIRK